MQGNTHKTGYLCINTLQPIEQMIKLATYTKVQLSNSKYNNNMSKLPTFAKVMIMRIVQQDGRRIPLPHFVWEWSAAQGNYANKLVSLLW